MTWHELLPYVIFIVTFIASILSGMSGGGGGFIITPFLIAIGLTPQHAIATAKLGGLGLDAGSVTAFRGKVLGSKRFTIFLTVIAIGTGAASSYFIRHIQNQHLQLVMGLLTLSMMPFVLIKHHKLKARRSHYIFQALGIVALIVIMLLQGTFSSGIGSLINVFLILFFGFSALQANVIKRRASIVMDVVMIAGLLGSGLINYHYGFIAMAGCIIGGFIGSRFAVREGENFARYALIIFMAASGIWLIASA